MKEKLKFIGFEALYLILVVIASVPAAAVQYLGKRNVGEHSSFIFSGIDYRYNYPAYFFGIVIFGLALYFLYTRILKSRLIRESIKGVGIKIFYVLVALIISFIAFVIQIAEYLLMVGLNNNILPEFFTFVTGFVWPVIIFVSAVVFLIKAAKNK